MTPPGRMATNKLLIVSASRASPEAFAEETLLGRSIQRLGFDRRIEARVAVSNRRGLSEIYNQQICEENRGMLLLFVHDDVWLDDCYVYDRLAQALATFDVVGLAGNTRRVPRQPAWGFVSDAPLVWDKKAHLSGVVAHGKQPGGPLSRYGAPGRRCVLLDGLFLAARCGTLLDRGVRFDERFKFHFYDMDFCRSAEQAGLSMGTWPIAVTHASDAVFGTASWREGLAAYFAKWEE